MSTLYELTDNYLMLLEMMDDPEVDPQAIWDTMDSITGELEDKADGYAKIIAELDSRIEGVSREIDRLTTRKRSMQTNVDRLKTALKESMQKTGRLKFKTKLFSFGLQEAGPKTNFRTTVPAEELPPRFRKQKVTYTADGDAIREWLESGKKSKFFEQIPRSISLRIR